MDVLDTLVMIVDHPHHIAAGKGHVSCVEQQRDAGMVHEGIEFRLGFDDRRHMVVIDDRHALALDPVSEFGHPPGIGLHLVARKLRLGRQRLRLVALDRAAHFAIDDARRVHGLEQVDHRLDALLVGLDRFIDNGAGEPATAQRDVGLLEDWHHFGSRLREAAALLHPGKTCRARLAQTLLQRHVIAQFRQIVVPPGDGRHAKFCFHGIILQCVAFCGSRHDAHAPSARQDGPILLAHPRPSRHPPAPTRTRRSRWK